MCGRSSGTTGGVPVDDSEQVEACHAVVLSLRGPIPDFSLASDAQCKAFFRAWWDSPLFRPIWARRCMAGSSAQSIMKRVRSMRRGRYGAGRRPACAGSDSGRPCLQGSNHFP